MKPADRAAVMKAVIMAGGEGTRLRPQTSNLPKPMLPLVGRPMMEHIVSLLRRHGITDIVVTVAFLPNAIRSYFGDGSELGVRMVYATEETPLGTAGSVRNARDELTERFLVISGDVLTDIDLTSMMEFHEKNNALATLALCAVENPLEFGIVITREDGSIERFLEKPGWGQVFSDTINTGIYVLEPEIFDLIPEGRAVDFSAEVFPAVLEAGGPIFGYVANGYWEDVGTTAAYLKAHEDILDGKVEVDISGFELQPGVWLGKGSSVDPSARLGGPAFIGENCTIDEDAVIGAYTTIGANTRVAERAEVRHSVIGGELLRRPGGPGRGRGARAVLRPAPGRPLRARFGRGGGLPHRGPRRSAGRRQGLPLQGGRGRRAGPVVHRVGVGWDPHALRARGRAGHRQRRRQPGAGGAPGQGVGLVVREGVGHHDLARHEPGGPGHQARAHGRMQLGRGERHRPGGGDHPGDPAPHPHQGHPGRPDRAPEPRRPAVGGHPLLRLPGPRPVGERAAADRAALPPRGVPPGHARATSATSTSPRARSSTTRPTWSRPSTCRTRPGRDLKLVLDLSYGAASFVMPNLLSKVQADVLSINPYAQTPGMISVDPTTSAARVVRSVRSSGADLGAVIDAGGEHLTLVDGTGHVLSNDEALMVFLELVTAAPNVAKGGREPVRVALPAHRQPEGAASCATPAGPRSSPPPCRRPS